MSVLCYNDILCFCFFLNVLLSFNQFYTILENFGLKTSSVCLLTYSKTCYYGGHSKYYFLTIKDKIQSLKKKKKKKQGQGLGRN